MSLSRSWNAGRLPFSSASGPGAACTSRGVLGLGVPQVTATVDCAAARDAYFKKTSRYVPIITDGGMSKGGDVCKALACGADAVMVGSAFAKAQEAPGRGYHWGMATPHANLPRGTRIKVGTTGSLKQILFGPAEVDDGSQNLVGAITTCMGNVGARNIAEFQQTEIIIAPSIKTEGKLFQTVKASGWERARRFRTVSDASLFNDLTVIYDTIAELLSPAWASSRRSATMSRRFGRNLKNGVSGIRADPCVRHHRHTIARSAGKSAISIRNRSSKIRRMSAAPIVLRSWPWRAAKMAMEDSGIDVEKVKRRDRFGVIVSSGIGGLKTLQDQHTSC